MASTYSDLKIELIGTGEQVGTWGATTNTNLGTALEEAITGSADVSFSSADVTLTLSNTNGTQTARNLRLVCTGTSGGARNLILGSGCQIEKLYLIQNDLADAVTVKNTTGTGVTVAAGDKRFVFNDGTNVVEATSNIVDLTSDVTGTLPIANGGTNATATPTQGGIAYGTGTAYAFSTAGTSGYALISAGTSAPTWQQVTNSNVASTIVARDASGNFTAGIITASLSGNATTATTATSAATLTTARTINGVSFNGSANIVVEPYVERDDSTNATRYLTFVDSTTAGYQRLNVDTSGPTYNPSTNVFTNAGDITANSDVRLKDNIEIIENALDKVCQIRGVTYTLKASNSRRHAGVIAQEVEEVLPEVVTENEDGIKAVAYGNLVGLLIEAIKDLRAEVNTLKNKE